MTGTAFTNAQHAVGSAKAAQRLRLVDSLKAACAKEGWQGLWRGNGINVLRAGPQKAIDFFAFAVYKVSHIAAAWQNSCAWQEMLGCIMSNTCMMYCDTHVSVHAVHKNALKECTDMWSQHSDPHLYQLRTVWGT